MITATAMTDVDGAPGGVGVPATQELADCLSSFRKDTVADDTPAFFSNFAAPAADAAHTWVSTRSIAAPTWRR